MKKIILGAAMAALLAVPAYAALDKGTAAPDFAAKATMAGKEFKFSLKDALKKGPAVVYFDPAAYTRGCNIEAHAFAENADKFAAANATIIGVSRDGIAKLNAFSSDPEYCAGKFPLASDFDGNITKAYQLKNMDLPAGMKDSRGDALDIPGATERTTFVIGKDAKVIATLSTADDKVMPADHALKSLEIVEGLKK
jgi:peroxiredoxin Q/BCP